MGSGQKVGDKGSVKACPDGSYLLNDRRPQGATLQMVALFTYKTILRGCIVRHISKGEKIVHPVLFKLGPFTLRSYGVMVALGVLAAMFWTRLEFRRRKLPNDLLYDLVVAAIALGVIGARLMYVALNWQSYRTNLVAIPMIWADGGLSFHGAIAGGILAGLWLSRRYKVPFWRIADAAAPGLALGHAIGRIGCFLNGCCYGLPTRMPWGVRFHNPALGIDTLPSHPTQLYEAAGLLILFVLLALYSRNISRPSSHL